MPSASHISLDQAKSDKLFYLVANVVIYRESDRRCLLLKRSEREVAHPGKFGVVGGKLEWSDLDVAKPDRLNGDVLDYLEIMEKLLQRETMEEAGVSIKGPLRYINSLAYIRPDSVPSVLIKFAAEWGSGQVKLESSSFSDFVWANAQEAKALPCIEGIAAEVEQTIYLFQSENII